MLATYIDFIPLRSHIGFTARLFTVAAYNYCPYRIFPSMPFNKRSLCASITLIFSTGLVLSTLPQSALAQLPQYSCRSNAAGDGWICESATSAAPILSTPLPRAPAVPTVPAVTTATTAVDHAATPTTPSATVETSRRAAPLSNYPLDWVPRADLTPAQLATVPDNCCGVYINPAAQQADSGDAPADAATVFNTVGRISQVAPDLLTVDGEILLQQGYRTIQNNGSTSIDRAADSVLLDGAVVFREPGILLTGSSAFIDNANGINRVESAQYVLHNYGAHGTADSIVYTSDAGLVTIENGEFSRCEPDSNFWYLDADQIVLNQVAGRGYATAVSIKLKDVPIFYYPYTLTFPLGDERISGFLAPSTGSTRSGGFDFELPYYLNLAPNYDVTIAPRLISDRGVMLGTELRYLSSWSMNTLNASYLGDDKLYDPATAFVPGSDSPTTDKRWYIGYEHFGALGANWSTYVDYNAVSDADYFYDLGSGGLNLASRTHLNRQAQLNYQSDWLRAGLNTQRIQIIDPFVATADLNRPYDRLPQFSFDTGTELLAGFRIDLNGAVTAFDRTLDRNALTATQLDNGALATGNRVNLEPEISWAAEAPGWFLRTRASYQHISYQLEQQALGTSDNPDLNIPVYSLDSGLVFERPLARGGFTQTLEPRLFYLFSDYEDQSQLPVFDTAEMSFSFNQLLRADRFSGGDRVADADQLTLALTSRLLDGQGKERLRASIGQILYFEDRLVSLNSPLQAWAPRYSPNANTSALAGEFAYAVGDNWRFKSDVQWNEDSHEVDEGSLQLRYQRDLSRLFNVAYRYRRLVNTPLFTLPAGVDPRIKQSDISGIWPLNGNWKLLARWNYDHSNARNLETFAGIEYSNCCATIRLVGREWVDEDELFLPNVEPNQGIFVQFTLHGLGNITGGGVSSLLSDGIWGFRENAYEQ